MTFCSLLPDRALLTVSGEDARSYLQGLITNDVTKVSTEKALFAVLLSPQGKYLFEFFILEHEGQLLLETDRERLPELIKRLTMYRLRAKVQFAEYMEHAVAAMWDITRIKNPDVGILYDDPRRPSLGKRIIYHRGNSTIAEEVNTHMADYEAHRISKGVPEGGKDLVIDRSILLEYGYDHLHAIDFNKGCYVGQEVTARSKHRATLHKYVHCVSADVPLPPAGTVVHSNGREIGELRSSQGKHGLALLRTADAALAQHMLADDVPIRASLPAWIAS